MGETSQWWRAFFGGPYTKIQGQVSSEERDRAEADFIEQALALKPDARVLDVPCGEGRIALLLAARGYRLTGVDFNASALETARLAAKNRKLRVPWEKRDMRELPWENAFDAAFCWCGSFGYFDEEGNRAFLEAVARALKPGGRFLLEGHCAESILPKFQPHGWSTVGETKILEDRRFDLESSRIISEWTFIKEGREEQHTISIRLYTYRELCELFDEAGLAEVKGFDTKTHEPFRLGAARLTLVGTKKG